jgi:polysaccharide export outer membrane protein
VRVLPLVLLLGRLAAGDSDGGYALFPGDVVQVAVLDEPDLSLRLAVPATGGCAYPLIGDLAPLAGRSPEAVRDEIRNRLLDGFLKRPVVTVTVAEFGPRTVWVVGAVLKPGAVRLDPLRATSAVQAIGEAGGFAEDADRASARVLRDDPATPGGKLALPLPAALLPDRDLVLHHGDVLVVPRADRVFVLGQVQRPGPVPVPAREPLTVSRALTLAGGFDRFAKETRVHLLRTGEPVRSLDLRAVLDGKAGAEDPVLRPGDTVFVPESRF